MCHAFRFGTVCHFRTERLVVGRWLRRGIRHSISFPSSTSALVNWNQGLVTYKHIVPVIPWVLAFGEQGTGKEGT